MKNEKTKQIDFITSYELSEIYGFGHISVEKLQTYIQYLHRVDDKGWSNTAIENEYGLSAQTVSNILSHKARAANKREG